MQGESKEGHCQHPSSYLRLFPWISMYELSSSIPVDLFLRSSYARWVLTTIPQAHRYDEHHQDRDMNDSPGA
jgi:hypothetical protein